ncbi:hypothetical protein SDC9_202145 [bioreactor metagenome]|uniref:Uncharacterized protein n=1 Tax=bioreactor metagenome TaxID=1076179 RepID=A0A645ISU7_9ZZZZ
MNRIFYDVDLKPDSDHAQEPAIVALHPEIHKYSNIIPISLVRIDFQIELMAGFRKIVIPDIMLIALRNCLIQAVLIVIVAGLRRDTEHGCIAVFLLVGLQIAV